MIKPNIFSHFVQKSNEATMLADNHPLMTIGMVSELLDIHPRTIRSYEDKGLINPIRKGAWRYYTSRDVQWIQCVREMIHDQGISINAVKKLLQYTPCWNIINCSIEKRRCCSAFFSNTLVPRKLPRTEPIPSQDDIAA